LGTQGGRQPAACLSLGKTLRGHGSLRVVSCVWVVEALLHDRLGAMTYCIPQWLRFDSG